MSKENYLIKIKGIQNFEDDNDSVMLTVRGNYYEEEGKKTLKYREYLTDNLDNYTDTIIEILNRDLVTINKTGELNTTIILEKGKRHECMYTTPVGTISMAFYTKSIDNSLSYQGGKLSITYNTDYLPGFSSENTLSVRIKKLEE